MPHLDLQKLTVGLSRTWAGFLRDWDRSLRSGNYPETTRYNYLLAAAQLGRYLAEHSPDPDADGAADDPCVVTRAHVEAFQAWMIETRSASTAVNKHKGLQQFFKWLTVDEQAIDRSPMERVRQPKTPQKLIPVMRDEDTKKLLDACKGNGFVNLRDELQRWELERRCDDLRQRLRRLTSGDIDKRVGRVVVRVAYEPGVWLSRSNGPRLAAPSPEGWGSGGR